MMYKGPLYGKLAGKYIPLEMDSEHVDAVIKERDELRAKLDRIADIANAEKEVAIICRRPGAAFGFDKIIKECE